MSEVAGDTGSVAAAPDAASEVGPLVRREGAGRRTRNLVDVVMDARSPTEARTEPGNDRGVRDPLGAAGPPTTRATGDGHGSIHRVASRSLEVRAAAAGQDAPPCLSPRLQEFMDRSLQIPAGRSFLRIGQPNDGKQDLDFELRSQPVDQFVAAIHGNAWSASVDQKLVSGYEVGLLVLNDPEYEVGREIYLHSCHAGLGTWPQDVANVTRVVVWGPTSYAFTTIDGLRFASDAAEFDIYGRPTRGVWPPNGGVKRFFPEPLPVQGGFGAGQQMRPPPGFGP